MSDTSKKYQILCTHCSCETQHQCLQEVSTIESNDTNDVHVSNDYQIVQCLGCRNISFRSNWTCSEDFEYINAHGEIEYTKHEQLYPERSSGKKPLEDLETLPETVQSIYKETIKALHSKQPILTGTGIRIIIELVCKEEKAKGRNLDEKIDNLVEIGSLTKANAELLHTTRLLGNKTAHEGQILPFESLDTALTIAENLLVNTYILPQKAKALIDKLST